MKEVLRKFLIAFFAGMTVVVLIVGIFRAKKVRTGPVASETDDSTTSTATNTQKEATPTSTNIQNATSTKPSDTKKTFLGDTYRIPWGDVQVGITVTNGVISEVTMPKVPSSPPSRYAEPLLISQATSAKSSNIQGVSGATYTSLAFKRSLESAIAQAGI